MDMAIKDTFSLLWRRHFNSAELPISFYYTDEEGHAEKVKPGSMPRCLIGALAEVRKEGLSALTLTPSVALAAEDMPASLTS
jgi:hypothetical protein